MHYLVAPLQYQFVLRGLLAVILMGTTCAILGAYVVLRRLAFIGDAISHSTLPGLVIAYRNGFSFFTGALAASILTALGIGSLSKGDAIREDTAIGVLFTAMFALGLLLIPTHSFIDFTGMLFGDVLSVTRADLLFMAIITAVILLTVALFYKELELTSVDPTYSAVIGLRANWLRNLLLVLLALAVVTGIQSVGVVLISALLVTPAAAASLLTRSLPRMMLLSIFFAVSSGIVGLYASFYMNVRSGPAIVLTGVSWFAMAFGVHKFEHRR